MNPKTTMLAVDALMRGLCPGLFRKHEPSILFSAHDPSVRAAVKDAAEQKRFRKQARGPGFGS